MCLEIMAFGTELSSVSLIFLVYNEYDVFHKVIARINMYYQYCL